MNNLAEALMIDSRSLSFSLLDQESLNIDIFIISFGPIFLAQTMSSNLVNYFFDYSITRSNLGLQYYKSNSSTYITSKKYILDEFYEIINYTKASKQSTTGYG